MISYEQCKTHGYLPQELVHGGKIPVGFIGRQPTARKSKIFERALRGELPKARESKRKSKIFERALRGGTAESEGIEEKIEDFRDRRFSSGHCEGAAENEPWQVKNITTA